MKKELTRLTKENPKKTKNKQKIFCFSPSAFFFAYNVKTCFLKNSDENQRKSSSFPLLPFTLSHLPLSLVWSFIFFGLSHYFLLFSFFFRIFSFQHFLLGQGGWGKDCLTFKPAQSVVKPIS